jgi:GNAT superfamily N-acetyltransferase
VTRGPTIRPATEADLPSVCDVWYATEIEGEADPPPNTAGPRFFAPVLEHGELFVADDGGAVTGFSGSIVRSGVRFLTDLFVRPDRQGGGVGRALLAAAMPDDGRERATLASRDPRALALYVRSGMRARFPHVLVDLAPAAARRTDGADGVSVRPADPEDPELHAWDTEVGGRERPQDLADLVATAAAEPVWLDRAGERVGYAFVQMASPAYLRHPDAVTVGPVGVRSGQDAAACVAAVVAWAADRAPLVSVGVPGPHPALHALLDAGGRVGYVELFLSTHEPFADPGRYVPAGSGGY